MKFDYNLAWRMLNDACFKGEMNAPKIHCYKGSLWSHDGVLLIGSYHPDSGEILMHTGTYADQHSGGQLEALYHEMVHQFIIEVLCDDDSPPHGALFHGVYNEGLRRLTTKKGCNEVGTRGTKESPNKYVKGGSKRTHGAGQAGVGPPGIKGSGTKQSKGPKKTR